MHQRFAETHRLGSQPLLSQISALLGITSGQKSKVLVATNSSSWHHLTLCSVLSHPHSAVEMQHFSSLLREIQSRAINTHPLGRNFPANFGFCPDDKSLDTAVLGDLLSTGTQPQASASSSASRMRLYLSWGADSPPASIPPGTGVRDVYSLLMYPNVPPAFDILKNTVTRLDLFLAHLQPCVQSSNTYLFHSTARQVSKPLASPSELHSSSSIEHQGVAHAHSTLSLL